jgi:deoxyribodipyrimidine photo-lyase
MRGLVWFRGDLRTVDNPALHHAARRADRGVVGVFLIARRQWDEHDWGPVKIDFILRSVAAHSAILAQLNIPLRVLEVPSFAGAPEALLTAAREHGCDELFANHEYEVNERRRDKRVAEVFTAAGLGVQFYHDQTVVPPDVLRTGKGGFYSVYTPFRRSWVAHVKERLPVALLPAPEAQAPTGIASDEVPIEYSHVSPEIWMAGEREAQRRLNQFLGFRVGDYHVKRDLPAEEGTSALSPYLAAGVISARQCLSAAMAANGGKLDEGREGVVTWIAELVWREFYRHVLVGWPRVSMNRPFKLATERVKWRNDAGEFERWRTGQTGVPIVDAAMRQMRQMGWMHNRVRMIAAMYLTKHLLIDWRWGERHFMRSLVDGDLASNNGGWQWSASTGTDAAPYFRIFNPVSQSTKCDEHGAYIRRFCPELASLDDKAIHDPPPLLRQACGYPEMLVDLKAGRERALAAFKLVDG